MGKMAEAQRKLLEQMMGPEAMGNVVQNVDWWNEKVCRNWLFGTCPHLIFGNTRMDLGPCPKLHSDKVLKEFQAHCAAQPNDPRIAAFKQEHENTIHGFIEDCDRRIRASQRKLEKTPEENRKTIDLMKEIGEIELAIQGGTEEIEALGEAGKVEESMEKLAAVDALKNLKTDKEKELQDLNENAGASGHQKLRVCETCGAMLSVLDSDKRLADHFGGKLHLGYHDLRQLLAKFAEDRMTGRQSIPGVASNGVPSNPPMNAPAGPRPNPPPSAPSGPSGRRPENGGLGVPGSPPPPHTPIDGPHVPPRDEMPAVGHGDKVKREAGELVEDVKESRSRRDSDMSGVDKDRYRDRERGDRYRDRDEGRDRHSDRERERDRDRDDRHRARDREDRHDRYERSSKYDDRDRSERSDRRDRDRERERKYDDDRRRDKERSKSPPKRRLV